MGIGDLPPVAEHLQNLLFGFTLSLELNDQTLNVLLDRCELSLKLLNLSTISQEIRGDIVQRNRQRKLLVSCFWGRIRFNWQINLNRLLKRCSSLSIGFDLLFSLKSLALGFSLSLKPLTLSPLVLVLNPLARVCLIGRNVKVDPVDLFDTTYIANPLSPDLFGLLGLGFGLAAMVNLGSKDFCRARSTFDSQTIGLGSSRPLFYNDP